MITVKQLNVQYQMRVLKDINFSVDRGELVVVLGESGCGKTTLLNTLAGLKNYEGEIERKGEVQVVFQNPRSSLDPMQTIGSMMKEIQQKFSSNISLEKLLNVTNLPQSILKQYPGELSGGQAQRVQVVRALLADREILLMDEPTSALDYIAQKKFLDLISEVHREFKKTIMLVTHNLQIAEYFNSRILLLDRGELIFDGKLEEGKDIPKLKEFTAAMIKNW